MRINNSQKPNCYPIQEQEGPSRKGKVEDQDGKTDLNFLLLSVQTFAIAFQYVTVNRTTNHMCHNNLSHTCHSHGPSLYKYSITPSCIELSSKHETLIAGFQLFVFLGSLWSSPRFSGSTKVFIPLSPRSRISIIDS